MCTWDGRFVPGYVVFREPPENQPFSIEWVDIHKVALFVTEEEAMDYCKYRNHALDVYDTDDVKKINHLVAVQ